MSAGPADVFPASFAQERMWFLGQFEQDRAVYNIGATLPMTFDQRFRPDCLEQALTEVVLRHEPLRTAFAVRDERVLQVIKPDVPIVVPRSDLSALPSPERTAALHRLEVEDAAQPFALDRAPLWRARLVRLTDEEWQLIWIVDHTIFDGRSADVFVNELYELYDALVAGRPPQLPTLRIQYADYSVWQQRRLADGLWDSQLGYWRDTLTGLPADVGIVTDYPRPAVRTDAGGMLEFDVSAELTDGIDDLARRTGSTWFMVLMAAFKVTLSRWSARTDIVLGCPVSGRVLPELEDLIGMFVNLLVIRTDLAGDPSFRTTLDRVRTSLLDALENQDVPFEKLVEALGPVRDPSRPPLYQIAFNMVPADTRGQVFNGTAKVDISIDVNVRGDRLHGRVEYNSDLFDARTVQRLINSFRLVLSAAVADDDKAISTLAVVDRADHALLADWAGTADSTGGGSVVEMFEQQVHAAPTAVAVVSGPRQMSYEELNAHADALALRLLRAGVGTESRVGLCLERSIEQLVGLLAVLKAGGSYVPMDPSLPDERLDFMVRDTGAAVLLTQSGLAAAARADLSVLLLDELCPPGDLGELPVGGPPPEAVAYTVYTSGSTGRPKAVDVEHQALATRVRWMRDRYGLGVDDRVLQFASLSFDTHAEEIYPCLAAGATLVIPPPRVHLPDYLRTAEGAALTVLDLPTSYWEELLIGPGPAHWPASLRLVVLGGSELRATALAAWYGTVGEHVRLVNTYGPTEATIIASAATLDRGEVARRPTIGQPVGDTRIQLLDGALEPVPIGAPGEVYIGGGGLARGYRNRPGLTAERFVPDPGGAAGSRLYATGDRARYRTDGLLEFLGRTDRQVKVRGHRIELGEIEARLLEHDGVDHVALAVRGNQSGDQELVAYVVPREYGTLEAVELRRYLARTLPEFMLPTAVMFLEKLPLTSTGKVDLDALPTPRRADGDGRNSVEPETESEQLVASVWGDVLGVGHVGALDDFFELGGHSLLAARMVTRLGTALGRTVPLRLIFIHRSVRTFAAAVDTDAATTSAPTYVAPGG